MIATETKKFAATDEKVPTHRVLVVDDEQLIRWSLRETLLQQGYRVSEAPDGRSAIRQLENGADKVDVVLLDLRLPDLDGLTVLERIKALQPDCQVILLTAYGTPETTEKALSDGAFLVTSKPFKVEDILRFIADALDSAGPRH